MYACLWMSARPCDAPVRAVSRIVRGQAAVTSPCPVRCTWRSRKCAVNHRWRRSRSCVRPGTTWTSFQSTALWTRAWLIASFNVAACLQRGAGSRWWVRGGAWCGGVAGGGSQGRGVQGREGQGGAGAEKSAMQPRLLSRAVWLHYLLQSPGIAACGRRPGASRPHPHRPCMHQQSRSKLVCQLGAAAALHVLTNACMHVH